MPLGLCGLAWGFGCAVKWLCIYSGLGLLVVFFYTVYQRVQEYRAAATEGRDEITSVFKKRLIATLIFCVGVFIVVPLIIYAVSYIPYENASPGFGLRGIIDNQEYMLTYHGNLVGQGEHAFQSKVLSWPLDIRPVFFFQSRNAVEGTIAGISCFGNPILLWGGVIAVIVLMCVRGNKKINLVGIPFVAIMGLAQYLPWMIISRETFIYHYFATIPFVVLAIVYLMRYLSENYGKKARVLSYVFVGICVLAFVCFYPMITGTPVSENWSNAMRWLPTWPFY